MVRPRLRYVKILAEILDCELVTEPFMVRTLKTFLKARRLDVFKLAAYLCRLRGEHTIPILSKP